jgi:hypothetical protein
MHTTTNPGHDPTDDTSKRGASNAEKHAAGVAGGAAAGILLGLFLGIRLNSGATKIERRLLDLREAWDIIRH